MYALQCHSCPYRSTCKQLRDVAVNLTVGRRLPRGNKIQHLAPEIAWRCWKPHRWNRTLKFAKLIDVDVRVLMILISIFWNYTAISTQNPAVVWNVLMWLSGWILAQILKYIYFNLKFKIETEKQTPTILELERSIRAKKVAFGCIYRSRSTWNQEVVAEITVSFSFSVAPLPQSFHALEQKGRASGSSYHINQLFSPSQSLPQMHFLH